MLLFFLIGIPICIIVYCILNIKKKDYLWNLLISIGILPFVALILTLIYSTINGSGLVGDKGGLESGVFAVGVVLFFFWYIYLGATILLIFSINKKKRKINDEKPISIIEKSLMFALIVTNIVYILNWFSVSIMNKPLLLYRLFNISENTYYGIGITVNKISETGISFKLDYISLIVFLCIIFTSSFIFLKIKEKKLNN